MLARGQAGSVAGKIGGGGRVAQPAAHDAMIAVRRANGGLRLLRRALEAVGDAAATAAFEPNYRELPERWISERIARTPSFSVAATERFPMRLTARSLQRQLVFARDCLVKIEDDGLRAAFEARVRALDKELSVWARKGKSHRRARNYAIVVRRAAQGEAAPKPARKRGFFKKKN